MNSPFLPLWLTLRAGIHPFRPGSWWGTAEAELLVDVTIECP
ncbi:hypothetical protein [Streptomyces yunnanensis]|uniref:Uncharacterized protein n=1 Tax=Streptomyces yunnanensis TaxID=156453 RepID=A0A9X8N0G6_9ACTN|nr:hypothetical protein [Streptomyces yunnanensis]SHM52283.1 hypothetical protein SAMN05216268_111295 [Streptomyces yunnanensis]